MNDADQLASDLKSTLGAQLKSVVLYGSGARPNASAAALNVVIVTDDLSVATLDRLAVPLEWWARRGHPPAALFSETSLTDSLDVFPIEFLDIKDRRTVVYGSDPFAGLVIDTKNLRQQVEYELRAAAMKLRTRYLARRLTRGALGDSLADSLPSITALFRATLRLLDSSVPDEPREVWRAMSNVHPSANETLFENVGRLRTKSDRAEKGLESLFTRFLAAVDKVIDVIDKLNR
jgi:hypothetical protein